MIVEAKNMKTEELIGALVELDKQGKENRALTNAYKAELQARGISIMDDHNVKYVKFYGDAGSASITDSMSLDILNPDKLKKLIGEGVWNTKVKESTETKYKYDGKFEKMLKAIFTGDYTFEVTLEEFLDQMPLKPDDKQKKLLLKKLKGDFEKDKDTLTSVLLGGVKDIVSICFRDRVYQRSLNDNAIYPAMTKSFIQHNCACQKDKGTDYARAVLDEFLHRHYRKYGRAGGVLQVDVHGYYPNMKHQVAKDKFKKHLEPDIYKRAEAVLEDQYEGDVGYNPGSQMIQIAGISVLDELDHFIKEQLGIKRYLRYMDDFLLMHEDFEYLEYCKDKVIEKLAEYGFEPNPKKTKVIPITEEILFLGFYYRLTETGKIIMRLNPANVKQERKKLYRLVAKAKKGEPSKAKVDECFNGWKDHAAKGTSYQLLRRMEAYYKELWRNQDGISTDQNKRL